MPEILKPPINVEEELNKALEDRSTPTTLSDVRIYFRSAFKSFITKAVVVEMLASLFTLVIYNFVRPYISPVINNWIVKLSTLFLIFLIVLVIVRANSGLLRVAKNLVDRNATYSTLTVKSLHKKQEDQT